MRPQQLRVKLLFDLGLFSSYSSSNDMVSNELLCLSLWSLILWMSFADCFPGRLLSFVSHYGDDKRGLFSLASVRSDSGDRILPVLMYNFPVTVVTNTAPPSKTGQRDFVLGVSLVRVDQEHGTPAAHVERKYPALRHHLRPLTDCTLEVTFG